MVTPLHFAHLDLLVPSNSLGGLQKFSLGSRCESDLLALPTLSMMLVLDSNCIQLPIIHTHPLRAILLIYLQ